mmetsp:Transcript_14806/g.25296  ORF Transcript_14806/g.25296 Transcript_14806/m.25296 type:complete len:102 (+) Transcript_14806:81-386(+)
MNNSKKSFSFHYGAPSINALAFGFGALVIGQPAGTSFMDGILSPSIVPIEAKKGLERRNTRPRKTTHGYRARTKTHNGRKVLQRRRSKGRHQISLSMECPF